VVAIIQSDQNQKELHAKLGALLDEIRETRAFIKTLFYEHLEVGEVHRCLSARAHVL
jgi:hypothetical protein